MVHIGEGEVLSNSMQIWSGYPHLHPSLYPNIRRSPQNLVHSSPTTFLFSFSCISLPHQDPEAPAGTSTVPALGKGTELILPILLSQSCFSYWLETLTIKQTLPKDFFFFQLAVSLGCSRWQELALREIWLSRLGGEDVQAHWVMQTLGRIFLTVLPPLSPLCLPSTFCVCLPRQAAIIMRTLLQ